MPYDTKHHIYDINSYARVQWDHNNTQQQQQQSD